MDFLHSAQLFATRSLFSQFCYTQRRRLCPVVAARICAQTMQAFQVQLLGLILSAKQEHTKKKRHLARKYDYISFALQLCL
jgi:hypothetical protein